MITSQELITRFEAQLLKANVALESAGLPLFYRGTLVGGLNSDYTFENTPRVIWKWWPMGFYLDQLYLIYEGQIINVYGLSGNDPHVI